MTEFYVVRHTQAEGNLYRMMQGHWNGRVTENGRHQIDCLAERFKNIHIDKVYSSDLQRAVDTAEGIVKYNGLEIFTDRRLREIDLGPIEQEFFGNVVHENPESAHEFMYDSEKWYLDGAETFNEVKERMYSFFLEAAAENEGKIVAVASHGISIRCLLSKIRNVPLSDIKNCPICKNTSVQHIIYDNGTFVCDYFNDTSHLPPEDSYHWWQTEDLRDEIINIEDSEQYYISCYEDAWRCAHRGDLSRFNAQSYVSLAKRHTLYKLFSGEKEAGLVELSERGISEGYGWICLLYLNEDYRYKGYGIQALGRAVRHFSKLGIHTLRLHCASENEAAIKFYEKNSFKIIGTESGSSYPLYLMERTL